MTALYSRYRTQRFDDGVAQEAVVRTLKNAVAGGRVSHAYLFTGIRGTGKTSTARILAKAVNCERSVDGEPCNECLSCVSITDSAATDMIEIDAASNRGVDEIRDLRDKARYLPAMLKRKVYIIDEAHQLTTEAFNALLKTLEEPPPHVLFILCTTEAHKLPATVVGRCQRFEFRRFGEGDIAAWLGHICQAESLAANASGLRLLAGMAQGSMRDAISMLDQLASAGVAVIDEEAVRLQLGVVSTVEVAALLAAAGSGDAGDALRRLSAMADQGADMRQLATAIANVARRAVLLGLGVGGGTEDDGLTDAEVAALGALARPEGATVAAAAFESAISAVAQLKQAPDARHLLELLLLRTAARAAGSGHRPHGHAEPSFTESVPPVHPSNAAPEPTSDADRRPEVGEPIPAPPSSLPSVAAAPSVAGGDLGEVRAGWDILLEGLKGAGGAGTRVRALLNDAAPLALESDRLTIGFRYAIHSERAQEPQNREALEGALQRAFGRPIRLAFQVDATLTPLRPGNAAPPATDDHQPPRVPAAPPPGPTEDAPRALPAMGAAVTPSNGEGSTGPLSGESLVRAAIDVLGARITDVRPRDDPPT